MPDSEGRPLVAGAVYLEQLKVMEEVAGKDRVSKAFGSLSAVDQDVLNAVLPVSWFDVTSSNRLIEALAVELDRDAYELNRQLTRLGVERTVKSLWRLLLRFTSDKALVSRCPILYNKNYDSGSLAAVINEPGRAEIVLDGWPGVPRMDIEGIGTGIEAILSLTGRRNVQMSWQRTPNGAKYQVRWSTD